MPLWQGTFFYVKNTGAADLIDLHPFDPAPPTKTNWSYNPRSLTTTNRIIRFMKQRMKDTDLCSDDIIRTFISRRVLPSAPRPQDERDPRTVSPDRIRQARSLEALIFPTPNPSSSKDLKRAELPPRALAKLRRNLPMYPQPTSTHMSIHVAPQAEALKSFVDKLMAVPCAQALASARGLCRLGQDLDSSSSLQPGTIWCRHLCLPLGAQQVRGARPLHRQIPARRRTLPPLQRPKTPAPATWAPERSCRAGGTLVPPILEKKKRKKTSSKPAPEASAPETSAPPPPPETSAPEATGPTPTPPPTQEAPATAPKPPPASLKIKPGASRGKATDGSASSGSQPLVLHTGPAAMTVQDKPSGLLGRIVELKRGGQDLGPLLPYAQRWNAADISAATRGREGPSQRRIRPSLNRRTLLAPQACREGVRQRVSTTPKALFEELLWEHRSLAEAHSKCLAIPEASIEALKDQVAKLQAEKGAAHPDHQEALDAQKEISRELKDQAMQAGVRQPRTEGRRAAAEAREEVLEDAGNANVVQAELEESAKALKQPRAKPPKHTKLPRRKPRKQPRARLRG
ncbi:hypothetical protein QYE76_014641 [Lolium multiflorum]|uniref:Uncharacterized protein n=1 Tax=Lolium multiflorum TaxID=4521 RepID=A0AAD8U535_LOLMU|nr:hypothetical protein QYE76_014641 [Lolium multiflorum]